MPVFYLDIRDGERLLEDSEGFDLPDFNAARAEAMDGVRQILAEIAKVGEVLDGQRFEIVDENGELLAVVPLKDVLRLA